MATATIEIDVGIPGATGLTLDLYPHTSDVVAVAGLSLTEATNRDGVFTTTTTAALTGLHRALVYSGASLLAGGYVYMSDTANVHVVAESAAIASIAANRVTANVDQLAGDATAATRLKHMANSVVSGTVAADGTNSSSSFKTDLTETATDYFGGSLGGCVLVFVSGTNNAVQARRISAYDGTSKFVTVESAFDAIPTDADTFVILGRIEV